MRIVIPPGQSISAVSSCVVLSHTEAREIRDALDLVLATRNAPCHVSVVWGEFETDVTLTLELDEDARTP